MIETKSETVTEVYMPQKEMSFLAAALASQIKELETV